MNLISGEISLGEASGVTPDRRLHEGKDFVHQLAYIYPSEKEVLLRKLTESGRAKLAAQRTELFENPKTRHLTIPLHEDNQLQNNSFELRIGDVLSMNMLLALSLIRRKNGGYVCTLTDDFSKLAEENIRAVVTSVSEKQPKLLFESWPSEYLTKEFITQRPGVRPTESLQIIKEPVTIGPSVTVSQETILTGHPHEDLRGWLSNAIRRNLPR